MGQAYADVAADGVPPTERDRTLPLRNVLLALQRRWWLVVGVFVAVVGVAMWRTALMPRLYRATATVRVGEAQAPIVGAPAPNYPNFRVDPIQSEQEIIRSQSVAERVATRFGLRLMVVRPSRLRRSALFGSTVPRVDAALDTGTYTLRLGPSEYTLMRGAGGGETATARYGAPVTLAGVSLTVPAPVKVEEQQVVLRIVPAEVAGAIVRGSTMTRGIPQTNIVQISYVGTDPVSIRDVANGVARAYDELASEARRLQARNRAEFIRQSLDTQRLRLAKSQEALKAFKEREQLSNVAAEQTALIQSIHELEGNRDAALVEQNIYSKLIGRLTAADTATEELKRLAGTDAVQKNQYIANLYERWFDLVKERERTIAQNKLDSHPDVQAIDRQIARTKDDLRSASGLYLEGLNSRIESLRSTIGGLRRELEKYPSLEAQEARLVADVKTLQTVYDQLQSEYQRARISESSEDAGVRVVDEADVPLSPIAPNRTRALMLAVLFGLLLGGGIAVTAEKLDDSVKSPDEVRDLLGMTVLGTIPRIRELSGVGRGRGEDATRLVMHVDPRSPVAEAYRSLRTNLAFARAHRELRVVVLTSPGPADGKSTTVANLAITFAQQGQRTLVIDADLRRAVLDKLFDLPRTPGLTDVLVGNEALMTAVRETEIRNLAVVGSGQFPPNPAELLGSPGMRRVLAEAKEHFDVVLLDSPPLLAVTDAAVLSTMVDGALLVVRVGATAKTAVRRAVAQLQTVSGRLVGCVLNDVDFRQGAFGGTYGYYYYYYYGRDGRTNGQNGHMLDRVRRLVGRPGDRMG